MGCECARLWALTKTNAAIFLLAASLLGLGAPVSYGLDAKPPKCGSVPVGQCAKTEGCCVLGLGGGCISCWWVPFAPVYSDPIFCAGIRSPRKCTRAGCLWRTSPRPRCYSPN